MPEYEDIIYSDENPIQVEDEVNVGGTWMKVLEFISGGSVRFCKDEHGRCEELWAGTIKQGRRPIKKEIVSGVKVCDVSEKRQWYPHGYHFTIVTERLSPDKKYALIELEEGE